MPINSSSLRALLRTERAGPAALVALGLSLFLFQHFVGLAQIPGFHFDEAWSANLAADLAAGLPARSQSPYTSPWSQLLAGAFFSAFGTSVLTFRLAGVLSAVLGVACLGLAMWRSGFRAAALLLPLSVALLPGLATNHRFAVEITGFHVLMFGLFILGLELRARRGPRQGAYALMLLASLLGVTSHVLFLAPLLGLLVALLLGGATLLRGDRLFLILLSLVLTPFFGRIALALPEKGKGIALCLFGLGVLAWALAGAKLPEIEDRLRKRLSLALGITSIPFLFNAFVFADGHWSYLVQIGGLIIPFFVALAGIGAFLVIYKVLRESVLEPEVKFWIRFSVSTTLAAGALMLKAAPRYYEIPMLMIAVGYAYAIAAFDWKRRLVLGFFLGGLVFSLFSLNYVTSIPGLAGNRDRELKFLAYKDSSRDFLQKTVLVERLAWHGCRPGEATTGDPRLAEALRFYARGDWPEPRAGADCRRAFGREAEAPQPRPADADDLGAFRIWRVE